MHATHLDSPNHKTVSYDSKVVGAKNEYHLKAYLLQLKLCLWHLPEKSLTCLDERLFCEVLLDIGIWLFHSFFDFFVFSMFGLSFLQE